MESEETTLKEYGLFVYVAGQEYPEYIHWTRKKPARIVIQELESAMTYAGIVPKWSPISSSEKTVPLD